MIYIMNQGGGAKELAIKVLGGATQPTGKAGYIWVNTATAIGKYTFSAAEPSGPVSGDVWIQTDAAGANKIELLRTADSVQVNILRVKQFNGTGWDVCAAYYHNGTDWTQVSYTFDPATDIAYSGDYTLLDDGGGNWRVKFLTSGVLTFSADPGSTMDVFLVGGGGGGGGDYGSGAGSGYTDTFTQAAVVDAGYTVTIGAGGNGGAYSSNGTSGGATSFNGVSVNGGHYGGSNNTTMGRNLGGEGGSGGGGNPAAGVGGTDGANGTGTNGGAGQGATTREFAEDGAALYAQGGRSSLGVENPSANEADNTGNGGDGNYYSSTGYTGGSGIVVIRNHREAA